MSEPLSRHENDQELTFCKMILVDIQKVHSCLILALVAGVLTACTDSPMLTQSEQGLQIEMVNPTSGKFGTAITISGSNFSTEPDKNIVTFNGIRAEVVSASVSQLEVLVPRGAGNGPIVVSVEGETVQREGFDYQYTVEVSTYAGVPGVNGHVNGQADQARLYEPAGIELSDDGTLYIVDYGNHIIRSVSPDRQVRTIAGSGIEGFVNGPGETARFERPLDVEVAPDGMVYVTDFGNHVIRQITPSGFVSTYAGSIEGYQDGPLLAARFNYPAGIALSSDNIFYVSDSDNNYIRTITMDGEVNTISGSGVRGFADGYRDDSQLEFPVGVDIADDGRLYIADHSNHSIRSVGSNQFLATFAGDDEPGYMDGAGTLARFSSPYDVAVDENNVVYVADFNNHTIRRISPKGEVQTIAGNGEAGYMDGEGSEARFRNPIGLAINRDGTVLFVADHYNHVIRKITIE